MSRPIPHCSSAVNNLSPSPTKADTVVERRMIVAAIQPDDTLGAGEMAVPTLLPDGALLRMTGCGVCGSDLDKLVHRKSPPGTVLGHEVVGVIDALAADYQGSFVVGQRVVVSHHTPCGACHYCRFGSESMCREFKRSNLTPGGFAQIIALSAAHLTKTTFAVPDGITDAEASCVEPLACTLRAIRRLGLQAGQSVVVVGLGFIGLMASQVFHRQGVTVVGLDLDPARRALASGWKTSNACVPDRTWLDAAFHPVDELEALNQALVEKTPLGQVDAVFLTVVTPQTLKQALELVRDGGSLLLFASASAQAQLNPSELYFREINVMTSYSPELQDLQAAAEMIFSRQIDVTSLVTHQLPLTEAARALELYRQGEAIKVLLTGETGSEPKESFHELTGQELAGQKLAGSGQP